jgi:pyruvate dehydrogenase E1 component beta subunit
MNAPITYGEAIRNAIYEVMESEQTVFCYGVGVSDELGIFGTTLGLAEKFGAERCFDTPISEDALSGFGLGAAIKGLRPVNIHIRVDFLLLCMNQLVNHISSYRFGSQGETNVPLTFRAVVGRGWGQGYQHSKSLHSMFSHVPGLEVYAPVTVAEAYHLTKRAILSKNPSIIIEHRWLYWQQGSIGDSSTAERGYSQLHEGEDVLIVATSWMSAEATLAARHLSQQGIGATVVSVNTLHKAMHEDIFDLARKTGRVIVADNDWVPSGFGSEMSSQIHEQCFDYLDGPVVRLGFEHSPTPTARHMEDDFYPDANDIVGAVSQILGRAVSPVPRDQLFSHETKFKGPF